MQGLRAARRVARREPIITHINPLLSDKDYCELLTKLIGITSENFNGAKRTRTADPLHAMQMLYQLSYGPLNIILHLMCFFMLFFTLKSYYLDNLKI